MAKKKFTKAKKRVEKRSEFRKHKNEPHPKYVYERNNNNYSYLSMTHSPPKYDKNNYVKLSRSANPEDKRDAYIKIMSETDHISNFGARKKGWGFTSADKKIVNSIVNKNRRRK